MRRRNDLDMAACLEPLVSGKPSGDQMVDVDNSNAGSTAAEGIATMNDTKLDLKTWIITIICLIFAGWALWDGRGQDFNPEHEYDVKNHGGLGF